MEADDQARTAQAGRIATELLGDLEAGGFKAALGGSLALGLWGAPRGTKDADLNVFAGVERHAALLDRLVAAGCTPRAERAEWTAADRAEFLRRASEGEVAVAYREGVRVDVFLPSIAFYDQAERTLRRARFRGQDVLVLSPEALAVFKLLFFRTKDLADLEVLVARRGQELDHAWVRAEIVGMLGEDDERVSRWDEIVRVHGPRP